jgi:hypothetical protein
MCNFLSFQFTFLTLFIMDATDTGITVPKTPTHGVKTGSQLNATPQALGSAAISEHLSAVGVTYVHFSCHCGHHTMLLNFVLHAASKIFVHGSRVTLRTTWKPT